jgi:hypothetical protein
VWVLGCREEPTIVIRFEPSDMTPAATRVAARSDAGGAISLGTDGGVRAIGAAPKRAAPAECHAAADCVVEPEECCDCANGGKQHAIPKANAAASKTARTKRCKGVFCTLMLSTDPTCGMRADCVDGRCVMTKKK